VAVVIALVSSSSTASGFSRSIISSSTRRHPPPSWISIRGGADVQTTTSTSLQSSLIGAIDTFYKTMPLASAFLTVCRYYVHMICLFISYVLLRNTYDDIDM